MMLPGHRFVEPLNFYVRSLHANVFAYVYTAEQIKLFHRGQLSGESYF